VAAARRVPIDDALWDEVKADPSPADRSSPA
jgi:hypothetical protein